MFFDEFIESPKFDFTAYNLKEGYDFKNFEMESRKTQEFHKVVLLDQTAENFFGKLNYEKNEGIIESINNILIDTIENLNPEFLKTILGGE